jgi:hypothetical protein
MSATSICSPADAALGGITLVSYGRAATSGRSVYEYVYDGTESGIAALANTLAEQGVTFRSDTSAGNHRLVATYGNDITNPALEVPDDLYSIRTEMLYVNLWSHPKVWPFLDDGSNVFAERKKVITDAISGGTALTGAYATDGAAQALYRALTRGVTSYPSPTRVFTRRREFSTGYPNQRTIEPNPRFYTRASLISLFDIPTSVAERIPQDPSQAAPSGSSWGWFLRQDDSEIIPAISKVRETLDFIFGAWDDYFFTKTTQ